MSFIGYLRDTQTEAKNTNWPSGRLTVSYTALVIGISIAVAAYLTIFDTAALYVLELFIQR
ncbi:MAG: preprotein translocase subunit SecE [bacterium]|nr:preprotein translocase subunit SecE [bacterium]